MKSIDYHLEYNAGEIVAIGFVCLVILFLTIFIAIPKKHQGYYLETSVMGDFPTHSVVNDWAYWTDSRAFTSLDMKETLAVYNELRGVK